MSSPPLLVAAILTSRVIVVLVKGTKRTFVKFHWKPHEGAHSLVWDEALKLGGQDPDFLRRDLAEYVFLVSTFDSFFSILVDSTLADDLPSDRAIEAGSYPKWELGVQLIAEEDEHNFDFDLLDCTKLVPEELVPVKWVGTMTLNRNPTNYFAGQSFAPSSKFNFVAYDLPS